MGEYIDVGFQNSFIPLTIVFSSLVLGIYALIGVEAENDDDDSDSGSGGLMQPIWHYLYITFLDFLLEILNNLYKDPINKIKEVKKEIKIKITTNISYRFERRLINNIKDLSKVEGRFKSSRFLLGIK